MTRTHFPSGLARTSKKDHAAKRPRRSQPPLPPIHSSNDAASLETYKNKFIYVSSFLVSQRDMFESVLRVTGTDTKDWTLRHEDATERYQAGLGELQTGARTGYLKLFYTRVFFPDGAGNFQARRALNNDALGLPRDDLDE